MLTGMFPDRESTESAYRTLSERGYTTDDVNLVMSDDTRKKHFAKGETEIGNKALEGAGTGSAIGGAVGAAVGVIAAIGTSVLIPGLGLVVAGPLAAGLAGAGAGGVGAAVSTSGAPGRSPTTSATTPAPATNAAAAINAASRPRERGGAGGRRMGRRRSSASTFRSASRIELTTLLPRLPRGSATRSRPRSHRGRCASAGRRDRRR